MRVNTCENCGKGFWTGDDYETICFSCAHALANKPRVEYVVKEVAPPIANKVRRPLKVKVKAVAKTIALPESRFMKSRREQAREYEQKRLEGYVYLMRSENGYYKIGISKNVGSRLYGLRRQFPIQIGVVHHFSCHDRRKVEKKLHKKYEKKRAENEWFNLTPRDVQWIMSLKDYQLG